MLKECDKKDATLAYIIKTMSEYDGLILHGKPTNVNIIKGNVGYQLTIKKKVPITKSLIDALEKTGDVATVSLESLQKTVDMFKAKSEALQKDVKLLLDILDKYRTAVDSFAAENCENMNDVEEFEEFYNIKVSGKLKNEIQAIEDLRG